jgi:hypothetical protein
MKGDLMRNQLRKGDEGLRGRGRSWRADEAMEIGNWGYRGKGIETDWLQ